VQKSLVGNRDDGIYVHRVSRPEDREGYIPDGCRLIAIGVVVHGDSPWVGSRGQFGQPVKDTLSLVAFVSSTPDDCTAVATTKLTWFVPFLATLHNVSFRDARRSLRNLRCVDFKGRLKSRVESEGDVPVWQDSKLCSLVG
jgi:hypothetical protein